MIFNPTLYVNKQIHAMRTGYWLSWSAVVVWAIMEIRTGVVLYSRPGVNVVSFVVIEDDVVLLFDIRIGVVLMLVGVEEFVEACCGFVVVEDKSNTGVVL